MGKDLKGKELGVGISQRSDGFYVGRFTTKYGQRKQKRFVRGIVGNTYEYQYKFLLQTGLRTGELVGLNWYNNESVCSHDRR